MVFKATLQKEIPIISWSLFRSSGTQIFFKTGVFRNFTTFVLESLYNKGLQLYLKQASTQVFSCEDCEIFTKSFVDRKPPATSVDLLFLTKSSVEWFVLKREDLVIVCVIDTLFVETIPTRFYWLTCRNQKLVQSKPLHQGL